MAAPRPGPSSSKRAPAPSADQEPDDIIGEFRRGKEIGKGSFATVYVAQHRKKKSYAAVKVVQQAKLSPRLKANLEGEINILKELQHPHIVALFSCQETPLYFYLIMEYCQLSDLSQFLKKRQTLATLPETGDIFRRYPNPVHGGFHEVLSRHFIKQIASALEYLRGKNLLHRDIKPQNLLLNPAPSIMSKLKLEEVPLAASENSLIPFRGVYSLPMLKIADFGFARHLPSTSLAETLCGSPLYMAPEILRYEKYDARADLWSAGTVLFEMVVGKAPFRASNHVELLRRIEKANDVITFDNKTMVISRGMKDLIRKLLKKSPLDRVSYEEFFADPVITGEIPGLVEEDRPLQTEIREASQISELSKRMAKQAINAPTQSRTSPDLASESRRPQETADNASWKSSDNELRQRPEDVLRRKSSANNTNQPASAAIEMQRRPSQRDQPTQRRPSITAHATAPGRQELQVGQGATSVAAPRMERRPSRASPLAGPPMVREPSTADPSRLTTDRAARDARERAAQDVAFEKEYVMVEKRAVEINAFADELDANRGSPQGAAIKRGALTGQPPAIAGMPPSSPSRLTQLMGGRPQAMHQRAGSYERRYAPSPQSATNMLTKALTAANNRLLGALGAASPFGEGASPPRGYGAFPAYPTPPAALLIGDVNDAKTPLDEDSKIVRTMEDAATRSDVIWGFAEVKYKQLVPSTPSAQDALGIQQIGAQERPASGSGAVDDDDMTITAIVGVAEEALVLYVKTLAILAKTIDLAGYWWSKHGRTETVNSETASRPSGSNNVDAGKRMNNVVQWARSRFNEALEKSEVVGRKLKATQLQLPLDHPGHPNNHPAASSSAVTYSAENIKITSGLTAERLMFDRAVEMSRGAAVNELMNEELVDCELQYATAIVLMEAVLEGDDEPLLRKPSAKKDRPGDEIVNGLETEDRQTVIKIIESTRSRLSILRKKMHAAAQAASKRSSQSGSGTVTPKPTETPAGLVAVAGTPPK